MSESIIMKSGKNGNEYTQYNTATVNGVQLAKGLYLVNAVVEKFGDYIEVTLSAEGEGMLDLHPKKFTGATGSYATADEAAISGVWFHPSAIREFDGFDEESLEKGSAEGLPVLGFSLASATEEDFAESKEAPSAEVDALLGAIGETSEAEAEEEVEEEEDENAAEEIAALMGE